MDSGSNRTIRKLLQVATKALALVAMLGGFAVLTSARQSGAAQAAAPQPKPRETRRGTITGTVTADQGKVVAFRVQAHNLDLQLWYTVFTNKGHYVVPQALPGEYEMFVDMGTYDSPRTALQLAAGETKTADFAIKEEDRSAVGRRRRRCSRGERSCEDRIRRHDGRYVSGGPRA